VGVLKIMQSTLVPKCGMLRSLAPRDLFEVCTRPQGHSVVTDARNRDVVGGNLYSGPGVIIDR
jgi:hypothetical protein